MNAKQIKIVIELLKKERSTFDLNTIRRQFISDIQDLITKKKIGKKHLLIQNAKLIKQEKDDKIEVFCYGLELLPYILSGVNLCPFEDNCFKECLVWTGINNMIQQGKMLEGKKLATVMSIRNKRSYLYNNDKIFFFKLLELEILKFHYLHQAMGQEAWFRLNIFSDLDFSQIIRKLSAHKCMFYGYTKDKSQEEFDNYKITYSFSKKMTIRQAKLLLQQNHNVAVIFDEKILPKTWNGFPVYDGDVTDHRMYDPKGVVVGLRRKNTIGKKTN